MDIQKLFSPTQITVATFVGGPLATTYMVKENYRAMGMPQAQKNSCIYGALITLLIFTIAWFLPENFPNMVLPMAYTALAFYWVEKNQLTREQIEQQAQFEFQSNGQVFGISIVSLLITLVIIFGVVFMFMPMDDLSPMMEQY